VRFQARVFEFHIAPVRRCFAEEEGRARGRVGLTPVMRFCDFDIPIGA
jgi:hypothetical protein